MSGSPSSGDARGERHAGEPPPRGSVHISSAVVLARPERTEAVAEAIARLAGAEVHYARSGRLVVTFETRDTHAVSRHLEHIARLGGVLSTNLVYHEVDEA